MTVFQHLLIAVRINYEKSRIKLSTQQRNIYSIFIIIGLIIYMNGTEKCNKIILYLICYCLLGIRGNEYCTFLISENRKYAYAY